MLIGLVRESVLQCFCHTCRAPLPVAAHRTHIPITKVKTKSRTALIQQPKRTQFVATEVRCQEKTRGGLRYEVILGEPEVKVSPPKKQVPSKGSLSVQDIKDKLKAAEERRQTVTANTKVIKFIEKKLMEEVMVSNVRDKSKRIPMVF